MLFSLLPLFFNFLCADIGDEQTLMSLESQKNQPNWKTLPPENPASPKIIRKPTVRGNLPPYLVRTKTSTSSESVECGRQFGVDLREEFTISMVV